MEPRRSRWPKNACLLLGGALALGLPGCGGGGGSSTPVAPATPPPVPNAVITATGAGNLVLHPSLDPRFAIAMETPIRVTETAGGSADWGFARMSIFLSGREIERLELGSADIVRVLGTNRINASSNTVYRVVFRFNSDDFDRVDITLGFSDVKDGRQFTVAVPFNSFPGVDINFTPLHLEYDKNPI